MFDRLARHVERAAGSPWAFVAAIISVIVWAGFGPFYGFSDTWQLICNTCSTIVTYLLVFLIQASQTANTKALHLKLDELIKATEGARDELVILEDLDTKTLDNIKQQIIDETGNPA